MLYFIIRIVNKTPRHNNIIRFELQTFFYYADIEVLLSESALKYQYIDNRNSENEVLYKVS